MEKELYLIYIHELGVNYKDINFYEFLFSNTKEGIDGVEWDSYPASGNPHPPKKDLIKEVGRIDGETKLILAQDNEQFSMWDALDGILPLGWENIDGLEEYPDKRLIFHFGMTLTDVKELLYERDITIKYEKKLKHNE